MRTQSIYSGNIFYCKLNISRDWRDRYVTTV